jgi:spore coat protein CotH
MMTARNKDLENKKGTLKQDMQYLIELMRKLKSNSDEVEERLYKLLTETLNLL